MDHGPWTMVHGPLTTDQFATATATTATAAYCYCYYIFGSFSPSMLCHIIGSSLQLISASAVVMSQTFPIMLSLRIVASSSWTMDRVGKMKFWCPHPGPSTGPRTLGLNPMLANGWPWLAMAGQSWPSEANVGQRWSWPALAGQGWPNESNVGQRWPWLAMASFWGEKVFHGQKPCRGAAPISFLLIFCDSIVCTSSSLRTLPTRTNPRP